MFSTLKFIARHPLSSRQPLRAFWRYGRWQIESRLRREVEFKWVEGSKLIVRNGMTGATGNIYCGLHEFGDMLFLLHFLRPNDLFVDVGANVGSYTVLASAVCRARSIAVEPDPNAMRSLKRNIEANKIEHRVLLVEAALGRTRGTVLFTMGRDTTNKVATAEDTSTRHVQLSTMDDLLHGKSPSLIKLDVEGYEGQVLGGATETLRNPGLMAIETETADDSVTKCLEGTGFCRYSYNPYERSLTDFSIPQTQQSANALFLRNIEVCRRRVEEAEKRNILGQLI
jgi:FkbM family methyltransferase